MTDKQKELQKLYGFDSGDVRWLPLGGVLLEYVGQDVVFVEYEKQEDGSWRNKFSEAKINSIDDFDPVTLTYHISYTISGETEAKEERIIPEGFSFDVMGQGVQNYMNRFIPYSLHMACVETDRMYRRLHNQWPVETSLPLEALKEIASSKEQKKTLQYAMNICAAIMPTKETETPDELDYEDSLWLFRISELRVKHTHKTNWKITLYDNHKKMYTLELNEEDYAKDGYLELYKGTELLGDVKILDLCKIS